VAEIVKNPIVDFFKGSSTKGNCMECKHSGRKGFKGCKCSAAWCPCHRMEFGHGGWTCNC
jgi:hypothetical protein